MHHRIIVPEFMAIRRMLQVRMRHVDIARRLNLSVWTISRIADDITLQLDPVPEDALPIDDAPPDYVAQNMRRCEGCGAMVYVWPCIACKLATATPGMDETI